MMAGVHVDLDGAWDSSRLTMHSVDARALGPHLRYTAPEKELKRALAFLREGMGRERFVLYGSGDFHYLAAGWLKRLTESLHPGITLISFDNHPDWDVRPPMWACGGWVNRALEMPSVERVSVWGCGNFELQFPARLFRNRRALANGRLQIHGWAQRQPAQAARMFDCMTRDNWRAQFGEFAHTLRSAALYLTVDLDALESEHALTNWENGLFTPEDIAWAIGELRRAGARIIGGDCCGAFSPPFYARRLQRWIANFDHPRLPAPTLQASQDTNHRSLELIWPALTGE